MEKNYIPKRLICNTIYRPLTEVKKEFWVAMPRLTLAKTPRLWKMTQQNHTVEFEDLDTTKLEFIHQRI